MAQHEKVTVDILIDGKPQPIFEDPHPQDNNKGKGSYFYVEAVDDARFTVKVTLSSDFELFEADGATVWLSLDGRKGWGHHLSRTSLSYLRSATFWTQPNYNATARQWQDEAFSFGKLRLVESTDTEDAPAGIQSLGQICVDVERVTRRLLSNPIPVKAEEEKAVTQVSEKLLKGKAIGSAIKPISTGFSQAPVRTHESIPLAGSKGIPVKLNILYRSKKALQSLGCIPRTPSPEPELAPMEEVRALRARLALLERGLETKTEAPGSVIDLTSAVANGRAQVKRERDNDSENHRQKRSRGSEIEVVDLTGD